jgi:hypothetical protein
MDDADVQQGLHKFERMLAHSRDLPELEERIQQGLYRDYVETGEALAEINDRKLYRLTEPKRTFAEYVQVRFGCARQTAYEYMNAAAVAVDLSARSDIHLPLRHARLLYRFDSDTRLRIPREIRNMTFREASAFVIEVLALACKRGRGNRRRASGTSGTSRRRAPVLRSVSWAITSSLSKKPYPSLMTRSGRKSERRSPDSGITPSSSRSRRRAWTTRYTSACMSASGNATRSD